MLWRSESAFERGLRVLVHAVTLLSLLMLIMTLVHRDIPAAHDSAAHFTYIHLFDRALHEGQFPVRWVEWVRAGYGQPLFNFYQPGFYYLTEITHVLVPSLTHSLQLTIVLAWWLGAWFTFAWLRDRGTVPAAAAAVIFAFSPYLVLDLFVRAAYPEFVAIAMAPGVLWALDRSLSREHMRDRLTLSLLLCVMALCHLPSLLIFSPVFAAYATYTAIVKRVSAGRVIAVLFACLLALGMAAFYVVPAMVELNHIKMHELTTQYFDFHHHFVAPAQWFDYEWKFGGSVEGPGDGMSFQVGPVQWLIVALTVVRVTTGAFRRRSDPLIVWLVVIAATLFLMTDASRRVWEEIPALAFIQFPWRLLMVISVACSLLAASLLAGVRDRRLQAAIALAAIGVQVFLMYDHLKPSGYIARAALDIDRPGWRYAATPSSAAFLEGGYSPVTVRQQPSVPLGRWSIADGDGRVRATSVRDHALALAVETARGLRLTLNTPLFPGWVVRIDGGDAPVSPHPELGYMQVTVPPGTHAIEASFTNTPIRHWSNIIALVSVGGCIVLLVRSFA